MVFCLGRGTVECLPPSWRFERQSLGWSRFPFSTSRGRVLVALICYQSQKLLGKCVEASSSSEARVTPSSLTAGVDETERLDAHE